MDHFVPRMPPFLLPNLCVTLEIIQTSRRERFASCTQISMLRADGPAPITCHGLLVFQSRVFSSSQPFQASRPPPSWPWRRVRSTSASVRDKAPGNFKLVAVTRFPPSFKIRPSHQHHFILRHGVPYQLQAFRRAPCRPGQGVQLEPRDNSAYGSRAAVRRRASPQEGSSPSDAQGLAQDGRFATNLPSARNRNVAHGLACEWVRLHTMLGRIFRCIGCRHAASPLGTA